MNRIFRMIAIAIAVIYVFGGSAAFAAKAKPKLKPKSSSTTHHETMGTTQLKGEYAEIGSTYTLGKDEPLNVRVVSAEYSVDPLTIGDTTHIVRFDEKFLVLRFQFHNPRQMERYLRWDTLGYTVVDGQDQNHDGLVDLGSDGIKGSVSQNLKPAQKISAFGAVVVPAAGEMPKLIIKSNDGLVLRYDLKGKVKGLPAPYADPADKSGATALATVPAELGTTYSIGYFNVKVTKSEYSTAESIGETTADENGRFLLVYLTIKNASMSNQYLRWDTFETKLTDADGVELERPTDLLQASKDKSFSNDVTPGQEFNFRYLVKIPKDTEAKQMTMKFNDGRTYVFKLGDSK